MSETRRILIVDDDQAIRRMLDRVFERNGFTVDCARDGFEAIEKLARHDYQVVLLDLMMPRVDGFGVIDFLRRTNESTLRKVIVLTASSMGRACEEPVVRVVSKPFDIHQLVCTAKECSES